MGAQSAPPITLSGFLRARVCPVCECVRVRDVFHARFCSTWLLDALVQHAMIRDAPHCDCRKKHASGICLGFSGVSFRLGYSIVPLVGAFPRAFLQGVPRGVPRT